MSSAGGSSHHTVQRRENLQLHAKLGTPTRYCINPVPLQPPCFQGLKQVTWCLVGPAPLNAFLWLLWRMYVYWNNIFWHQNENWLARFGFVTWINIQIFLINVMEQRVCFSLQATIKSNPQSLLATVKDLSEVTWGRVPFKLTLIKLMVERSLIFTLVKLGATKRLLGAASTDRPA